MGVLCRTPSKKEKERWQLCYWECTKPERGAYPRQPLKNLQRQKKTSLRLSNSQVDITHQVQISNWSHSHCYSRKRTWPHLSVAAEFIQQTGRPFVLAHWIGLKGKKKKNTTKTTWIILLEALCNLWKATSAVRSLHSWENWEVSATSLDIYISKGGFSGPGERHSWVSKQTKSLFHSSKGFTHILKGKESSSDYRVPKVKSKRIGRRDIPFLSPGRIKPLTSGLLSCCHNAKPVLKLTGGQLGPTRELPQNFYSKRQILTETVIMSSHPFCSWITELGDLHEHL